MFMVTFLALWLFGASHTGTDKKNWSHVNRLYLRKEIMLLCDLLYVSPAVSAGWRVSSSGTSVNERGRHDPQKLLELRGKHEAIRKRG